MSDTKSGRPQMNRREFLRCLTGAAAGAGVLSLPMGRWRAFAQAGPQRLADRILILNCFGGIRSSAAFHASAETRLNPWGLMEGTSELRLGKLLGDHVDDAMLSPTGEAQAPLPDAAYNLGGAWGNERLPRLREVAGQFSVVGTWNERRGDHITSQIEETTGGTRNDPGLLTRVNMALAAELGEVEVPSFAINVAESVLFGVAPGPSATHSPVTLADFSDLPGNSHLPPELLARVGHRWAGSGAPFDRLDARVLQTLSGANRVLAEAHLTQRRSLVQLGEQLAEPWMDTSMGAESFGEVEVGGSSVPLTNAMLMEAFVRGLGPAPDDPTRTQPLSPDMVLLHPYARDAQNLALGIRLLQLGAPVVVVEFQTFDLHADERTMGPDRYGTVGRWWATLHWLLGRMRDPADSGRSMLDRTMVVTTSEFGRDPAMSERGFNDGDGSDHGAFPSCYYLAHAVMGAGVSGGRMLAQVETGGYSAYDARLADERYSTHQFLGTLLYALGLDQASEDWGFPDAGGPITRLWG